MYDRVTWGSGGYLQRHPYAYTSFKMAESIVVVVVRSTIPIFTAAPAYVYSHILFSKTILQKLFWSLSEGPRGSTPTFSNSSPCATYPRIFSRLSKPIYARREAVEFILQRHPYTSTSNVTLHFHLHPMKSSALTTVSTRHISYFYRDFTKALPFKNFLDPFQRLPGLNATIFGFPSLLYVP